MLFQQAEGLGWGLGLAVFAEQIHPALSAILICISASSIQMKYVFSQAGICGTVLVVCVFDQFFFFHLISNQDSDVSRGSDASAKMKSTFELGFQVIFLSRSLQWWVSLPHRLELVRQNRGRPKYQLQPGNKHTHLEGFYIYD